MEIKVADRGRLKN